MRRLNLFWKYVVIIVFLITGVLVTSGLVQLFFSFRESQTALATIQRGEAAKAALRIDGFLRDIERQLQSTLAPAGVLVAPAERLDAFYRLLRQAPAVTDLSFVDGNGVETLRLSRIAPNTIGPGTDRSRDPALEARSGRTYFGELYFRDESEPYLTIAVAERRRDGGVVIAEVNLKLIWDVVSRIKIGSAGYAYVVDRNGQLVAHPDISLVLQKADFSGLVQVRLARSGGATDDAVIAKDLRGHDVLSAAQAIDPLGWWVIVEQPLADAFAPLYASAARTALLLLLGVVIAMVASLRLARYMVKPIDALGAGAARIGAGDLEHRIEVRTGDELEGLAREFNEMTAKLRGSYAGLERKVEERTADLAEALEQQTAVADVLAAISRSVFDLQSVLDVVVERAAKVSGAQQGWIRQREGDLLRFVAYYGNSPELRAMFDELRHAGDTASIETSAFAGRAVREGRTIQIADVTQDRELRPSSLILRGGARTGLAVPLRREGLVVGALVLARDHVRSFTDREIGLVETFADQAVIAIENARLIGEIQEKGRQLEIASRHKSEFLANMSHELRTPLNAIIGFSEVLVERLFGDLNEKQEEYIHDILSSGHHLLSLINDILDLSKIEAGRMDLQLGTFSLREVLENGVMMVRERAIRQRITLSVRIADDIGDLDADERKVRQVIFNLLSNAVKFTPEGGQIDVLARRGDGSVEIAVRDSGIGIAPADQARIFEEFQQVGGALQAQEGTGLGLALAKRFVELHGGRIWVDSAPGAGSTFTFTLPVRAPTAEAAPARS